MFREDTVDALRSGSRLYPGAGHFLLVDRMDEILTALSAGFAQ